VSSVSQNPPDAGRIIHSLLLAEFYLPHRGGSRSYYDHVYRGWEPDRITLLTKKVPGWQEFDSRESNEYFRIIRRFAPLETCRYQELPKVALPFLQALAWSVIRPVDVVHCGDLFPCAGIALALKRIFGLPYIAYSHGEDITLTARYRYQPRIRNYLYQGADAVITSSENARRMLLEIGLPPDRVHAITPGVDCTEFSPAPKDAGLLVRYALQDKFVVLTVARLVARKGHDMVMRAVAKLANDFPQLRYLIVGRGPEEEKLRQLAGELGISERVVFAGFVPQEQLPAFYRLGDVMAMPNRECNGDMEGFGMTFLEANAVGRPVIGGLSGGTDESIADGVSGLRVEPTDVEELTAAIYSLVSQPQKAEAMGAAGLQRVRTQFDWKPRTERVRQITRELAFRKRTRRVPSDPLP
jgi:phosphatidylinositol alpha-1,6-mannosyltransferase